jgi:hypothetical protein
MYVVIVMQLLSMGIGDRLTEGRRPTTEQIAQDCDGCRIMGSGVFYMSSGYMMLEALRNTARSAKGFYAITGIALAGLGT